MVHLVYKKHGIFVYTAIGSSPGSVTKKCTEPYSMCTRILVTPEFFRSPAELSCAFLES